MLTEIAHLTKKFLIDHVKAPCCADHQDNTQIEEVIPFQFLNTVTVCARLRLFKGVASTQCSEFIFKEFLFVFKSCCVLSQEVADGAVLIQC